MSKIITNYRRKPIPTAAFDWSAMREGYCGCGECNPPIGYGASEEAAIADLLETERDRVDERGA